jgi:hypothetical protein
MTIPHSTAFSGIRWRVSVLPEAIHRRLIRVVHVTEAHNAPATPATIHGGKSTLDFNS